MAQWRCFVFISAPKTNIMEKKPKLSIVVPVYNQSAFTAQCIRNIQDVCKNIDYKLLIIDDASTDNTKQVVQHLRHDKIRYFKFENNVGVTKAWNKWVEFANGEYICVINNDVLFLEWHFEQLMEWLDDQKNKVIMTCPRFTEWMKAFAWPVIYYKEHINGHCYCFKSAMKHKLFPLDERMRIFWSDNRLYYHFKEQWYTLKLMKDAICHHFKSQTSFFVENKDVPIFHAIAKERWRNVVPVETPSDIPTTDLIF